MIPLNWKAVLAIVLILSQLFLYVNADAIYGVYSDMVRNTMTVYLMLLAVFSALVFKELVKIGPQDLPGFTIGFIVTAALLMGLNTFGLSGSILGQIEPGLTMALGFGLLHAMVKAFDEELIFRGVLPTFLGGSIYADILSSVFFGLFHFAVTGADLFAMIFLMGLGFVWALLRRRMGLLASTGSHFAYNLMALGVLPMII